MRRYGTAYSLGDRELADVLEARNKEIEGLRRALVVLEHAAEERVRVLREEVERLRALAFPGCKHEQHDVIQQGQTYCRWKCKACGFYGESSWD